MSSHYVRGKVKTSTAQLDRRAILALSVGAGAAALFAALRGKATAGNISLDGGVAIKGHDPVAYFDQDAAIAGKASITARHEGATYLFSSQANRDRFAADPEKYAPQFGGYCAYAVANGYTAPIDPEAFTVHNGRLYLNFSKGVRRRWERDIDGNIAKGNENWPALAAS